MGIPANHPDVLRLLANGQAVDTTRRHREPKAKRQPSTGTLAMVVVPVPPSMNNLYPTRGGKRCISRQYARWKKQAYPILARLAAVQVYPVHVWLTLMGNVSMRRDVANIEKAIGDGLVACGVLVDDSLKYVRGTHQVYGGGCGEPCVIVEVKCDGHLRGLRPRLG